MSGRVIPWLSAPNFSDERYLENIDPVAQTIFYRNLGMWLADRACKDCEKSMPTARAISCLDAGWRFLMSECQSPIEEILGSELIFITDGYHPVEHDPFPNSANQAPEPTFGTLFRSQDKICGYATDFSFHCFANGQSHTIVIEADGHDFHEKTKDQVRRDKSRDRKMVLAGVTVLRYSGSEIFRDPGHCADEISTALYGAIDRILGFIKEAS